MDHLFSRLLAFDFSEEFSRDLIGSAAQSKMSEYESILRNVNSTTPSAPAPSSKSILTQVKSRFAVDPGSRKSWRLNRKVVMFVGPPGAGKTTSIVKLAVQLGLEQDLPIHLLSLDTLRVAGSEQLSAFGRILGVGFTALHTPEALAEALEAASGQETDLDRYAGLCGGRQRRNGENGSSSSAITKRSKCNWFFLRLCALRPCGNSSDVSPHSSPRRWSTLTWTKLTLSGRWSKTLSRRGCQSRSWQTASQFHKICTKQQKTGFLKAYSPTLGPLPFLRPSYLP